MRTAAVRAQLLCGKGDRGARDDGAIVGLKAHPTSYAGATKTQTGAETSEEGIPEGMFGLRSPTDGIFYRRPNPQSPNYVEEGQVVTTGTALGLVEVMKCFNSIVYPGKPEFPPEAKITRILPGDASEVNHGSLLFIVEPVFIHGAAQG